jgi:hypothetical protein
MVIEMPIATAAVVIAATTVIRKLRAALERGPQDAGHAGAPTRAVCGASCRWSCERGPSHDGAEERV